MAGSNSDDSSNSSRAPDNFHISAISNDNDDDGCSHSWSGSPVKCPLCAYSKKSFHCRDCVRIGDFIHSTNHLSTTERFCEKQLKYYNVKSTHRLLDAKCNQLLAKKKIVEDFRTKILRKKEKIFYLHRLIEERQAALAKSRLQQEEILKANKDTKHKFPHYEHNLFSLKDYVDRRRDDIDKMSKNRAELQLELKYRVRHNVQTLLKYIFPISETISKSDLTTDLPTSTADLATPHDTVSALADATRTAYVRGKWVLQDSQNELQHIIVAPALPGNGDYSAYNNWVATNKDGVPSSTGGTIDALSSTNNAYRISAALTYTTQFVHLLSYYLDVRLPYKIAYGDFCKKELSEQSFTRKVARLNANILFLCYTQRVKLTTLCPTHTLENIQKLLNTEISDLGRFGAVEISDGFTLGGTTDSQLARDLNTGDDSESDDDSALPNEWETIPHLSPLETSMQPQHQSMMHPNQQQVTSMAGGLVNNAMASVTSIWRVWTTGR